MWSLSARADKRRIRSGLARWLTRVLNCTGRVFGRCSRCASMLPPRSTSANRRSVRSQIASDRGQNGECIEDQAAFFADVARPKPKPHARFPEQEIARRTAPAQLLKIVRSERELPRDVDRSERDRYSRFQHRGSRRGIFEDVCIVNAMRPRRTKCGRMTGRLAADDDHPLDV